MKVGMHFAIATPPNYTLTEGMMNWVRSMSMAVVSIEVYEIQAWQLADADIICTHVWTSMGREKKRPYA